MDKNYRKINKNDYEEIMNLILETWSIREDFSNSKALNLYLKAFLFDYLAWSNYQIAVTNNNIIVGFLLGRSDKKSCLKQWLRFTPKSLAAKLQLFFYPSGKTGLRILRITNRVNRKLIMHHAKDYQGELCLFAVKPKDKGSGYGVGLLSEFHEFLKKTKAKNYFLYTDTDCNVGFYEHQGYQLISLDTVRFFPGEKDQAKYFLFCKEMTQ